MTTTQQQPTLSVQAIERIWFAASVLDNAPELEAVVVIRHDSLGYIGSGEFTSVKGALRGYKRHAAKSYAAATYIVTRSQGESFGIERMA